MMARKTSETEFSTRSGHTLLLRPVSPLLLQEVQDAVAAELREAGVRIDPPTYMVRNVDGSETEFAHVVDPSAGVDTVHSGTPEEQAANEVAWNEYQAGLRKLTTLRAERLTRVLYGEGIDLSADSAYAAGDWERRLAYYGLRVPATEPERTVCYVQNVCVTSADETAELVTRLTLLSNLGVVSEERVQRAMAFFRDRTTRGTAERPGGAPGEGAVDAFSGAGGDADG